LRGDVFFDVPFAESPYTTTVISVLTDLQRMTLRALCMRATVCATLLGIPATACAATNDSTMFIADAQATPSPQPSGSGETNGAPTPTQQNASKRNPQSPVQAPVPPPQNTGMFGNLGGARSDLAKRGFTFNGDIVSEFAGNATGGIPTGGTSSDRGTALSSEVAVGFDANLGTLTNSDA
jgi:carbohydrate-selective porin OprB